RSRRAHPVRARGYAGRRGTGPGDTRGTAGRRGGSAGLRVIIRRAGEAALLIEVDDFGMAQRVRACLLRASIPGVRELVPGLRSVLVTADPLKVDLDALAARLPDCDHGDTPAQRGREIE